MSKRKRKAPLSYKEAWERKIRIKQGITIIMTVTSLVVAVVALVTKINS